MVFCYSGLNRLRYLEIEGRKDKVEIKLGWFILVFGNFFFDIVFLGVCGGVVGWRGMVESSWC